MTDGEFHTLRTRGEKRAVHIWQLVHDCRQAVMHKSEDTLTRMLTLSYCKFLPPQCGRGLCHYVVFNHITHESLQGAIDGPFGISVLSLTLGA